MATEETTTNVNKANVTVAKPKVSGAVFRAPFGTALPEDAVTELAAEFKSLGYVSEDGVTNTMSSEKEQTKAWGGDVVLDLDNGSSDSFKMKLIESLNIEVLKSVFGDKNVEGTIESGIAIKVKSEEREEYSWVIDTILKGGILKRLVIPKASISEVGDVVYKDNEAIGYDTTLTAVADAEGNTHYEYIKKPTQS